MKIAIILPALVNQGPVTVAKDIVCGILEKNPEIEFTVFYFDKKTEIEFPCKCINISLWEKIDFSSFDVIHSHMLRPDFFVWWNRKKMKNTFKVTTLHQNIVANLTASYNRVIANVFNFIWLKFLNTFDKVVTLSGVMTQMYIHKIEKSKLLTIYNGRQFVLNDSKSIESEDDLLLKKLKDKYTIIGVVALLTKRKGVHQLINALVDLPNYALVIIGNGIEEETLINKSKELGVFDRCYFAGYKKNGKDYMPYFDIFAMTSYSEGFPLSVLEVSQFKKSVVCSKIPLFREIFDENDVSFFELDNIESLRKAILNAEENKEFLSSNLYNKVNTKYSYDAMINNYLNLYKSNISNKK
mgnify:CR=1 FL=1